MAEPVVPALRNPAIVNGPATSSSSLRVYAEIRYQRIPIPIGVLGRVFAIQSRARVASEDGTEPSYRKAGANRGFLRSLRDAPSRRAPEQDVDLDWSISH